MNRFLYYGFSGKHFVEEYVEEALELLSCDGIEEIPYTKLYQGGSGFLRYIDGCCCFIVKHPSTAIKARQVDSKFMNHLPSFCGFRLSQYEDEWHVKGQLPLSSIQGIGFPMEQLKIWDWQENPYFQSQLKELLQQAELLQLDIVDTSEAYFPKKYEEAKLASDKRIFDSSLSLVANGEYHSKYFYHGFDSGNAEMIDKVFQVLTTGGIKCRNLLGYESTRGYNGSEYVSLCRKYNKAEYYEDRSNAYYHYIFNSFCFIVSDDIPAFKLALDDILSNELDSSFDYRVSDMFDEWQVYEQVPLSSIIGLGVPIKKLKHIMRNLNREYFEKLRRILLIAQELGMDIVDSSEKDFIEKYEKEKKKNPNKRYQIRIDIYNNLK